MRGIRQVRSSTATPSATSAAINASIANIVTRVRIKLMEVNENPGFSTVTIAWNSLFFGYPRHDEELAKKRP